MQPNMAYPNMTDVVGWPRTQFVRRDCMWRHSLRERGIAISSNVVDSFCKNLDAQHLKCSAMRWRKTQRPAVQTIRAPIKSGPFAGHGSDCGQSYPAQQHTREPIRGFGSLVLLAQAIRPWPRRCYIAVSAPDTAAAG